MIDRDDLEKALQEWKRDHSESLDIADVLDILDQQGWVSQADIEYHPRVRALKSALGNGQRWLAEVKAERDAALREAVRYEPTLACLSRLAAGWKHDMGEWYLPFTARPSEPMTKAEQEVMASLYRQVTEGEEG